MDAIPCRKLHLGIRIGLAIAVGLIVLITIILVAAGGGNADSWPGKWLDIGDKDAGDYVCQALPKSVSINGTSSATTTMTCPTMTHLGGSWKSYGDKCFYGGSKVAAKNRDHAQTLCRQLGSTLAEIYSAEEDAFAYKFCAKGERFCIFGLKGRKNGKEADWRWMSGSTSTYRNWMKEGQWNEPTGGEETTISWLTPKFRDEVMAGAFIGFIVLIVYLLVVISCCTGNSICVVCALNKTKPNKCCMILSASMDGVMAGFLLLFALGSVFNVERDPGQAISGLITNLALFGFFLAGSILGCCQCTPIGIAADKSSMPPPVIVGAAVAAPVLVGNPVEIGNETNK